MSFVIFIEVPCADPNDVVVHSPTPSMFKIAELLKGELKNE